MILVLSTLLLVVAVVVGAPMIALGVGALLYVTAASGGRPNKSDLFASAFITAVGAAFIIAAAINLGTRL